ncbi:hypothetical protein CA265_20250 [Sphingobacteriaceae bacterium GW460-11-11-14-LB5]|nr:hypothetical protein CA265_20250 [Sphingobacteriaceae bacterium GW460-11-11-14-LB5]
MTAINSPEKVYLHLDKTYYLAGDTIWLKGYTVDARTSLPSKKSGVLYVELFKGQKTLKKRVIPLTSGFGWGDIALPDTLSTGTYRIRAYTQWMRNWPTEFFFDKTVKIGGLKSENLITNTVYNYNSNLLTSADISFANSKNIPYIHLPVNYTINIGNNRTEVIKAVTDNAGKLHISLPIEKLDNASKGTVRLTVSMTNEKSISRTFDLAIDNDSIDLQFFPEGGQMVAGLPCRIGYKAINTNGLGTKLTGSVFDQNGTVLASLSESYLGMGSFYLTPQIGSIYTAKITTSSGRNLAFNLPKSIASGYNLAISEKDSNEFLVKVLASEDLVAVGNLHLVAQHNGEIYSDMLIKNPQQINTLKIRKDSLPVGTLLFTLLNIEGLPVCERLVFVNKKPDKIEIQIEKLDSIYALHQQMDIGLIAKTMDKVVQGSLSVSVINSNMVQTEEDDEGNILATLLLTSELSGHVEKPNRYFINRDSATIARLDNLLLTQGWRKVDWEKIERPGLFEFPVEKKLQISGKVFQGEKPVINGKVLLVTAGKNFNIDQSTTDKNGQFLFEPTFTDTVGFAIRAATESGQKSVEIKIDEAIIPEVGIKDITNYIDDYPQKPLDYRKHREDYKALLIKKGLLSGVTELEDVEILAKKKKYELPVDAKANLVSATKMQTIYQADFGGVADISEYLTRHLKGGVIMKTDKQGYERLMLAEPGIVKDAATKKMYTYDKPLVVYINGRALEESFNIRELPSKQIEHINFFIKDELREDGYVKFGYLEIVMNKDGVYWQNYHKNVSGMASIIRQGYSISNSFYSPKYAIKPIEQRADLRSTIFWMPHVSPNLEGKFNLKYFNGSVPGKYKVLIEGIDLQGNLARRSFYYEVR